MSTRQKIAVAVILPVLGIAVFIGWRMVNTVRHIPDAYAAWDTGTLLVEYMRSHDNKMAVVMGRSVVRDERQRGARILLRGASAGEH